MRLPFPSCSQLDRNTPFAIDRSRHLLLDNTYSQTFYGIHALGHEVEVRSVYG